MADQRITALTELSVPDLLDALEIIDVSDATDDASGSSRRVQAQRLLANLLPKYAEGRLTLTTGVPVTTSDVTAAGTLYYTPYLGNKISVYDGTRWELLTFTERSLALTLTSAKNYDVFIYDNAGTLTLELSAAWTNDSTRADALATQDGVDVKSGAATRRWIGTIRASGTNTTEDSGANRLVWNAYNQVAKDGARDDDAHSHTVNNTTQEWNAGTALRIGFVVGQAGVRVAQSVSANLQQVSVTANSLLWGALNGTTQTTRAQFNLNAGLVSAQAVQLWASELWRPTLGYNYLTVVEQEATSTNSIFDLGRNRATIFC